MANQQPTTLVVTVDDDPAVRLAIGGTRGSNVYINTDDAVTLGASDVDDATGLVIDETMAKPVHIVLGPGEELWGICAAAANAAVQVLVTDIK